MGSAGSPETNNTKKLLTYMKNPHLFRPAVGDASRQSYLDTMAASAIPCALMAASFHIAIVALLILSTSSPW